MVETIIVGGIDEPVGGIDEPVGGIDEPGFDGV
jgi:hypothetical protein